MPAFNNQKAIKRHGVTVSFALNYLKDLNKKMIKEEKRLVYYCATGKYIDIVKTSINELKKYHSGDIIVLTNNSDIKISGVKFFKYHEDPTIGRAYIDKYVDVNYYDKIMYLDADAIPLKNFYKIWDISNKNIGVSVQTLKIGQCRYRYKFWFTEKMNNDEITKYKDRHVINSGVLITKINIFKEWRKIINNKRYEDQSSLNKLLITGNYEYHEIKELISSEKWMFNTEPNGSLYHFCDKNVEEKISRIKAMFP